MVWSLCSPHDLYLLYSRATKLRIAAGRPESLLNVSCRLRSACFPLFRFQKAGIVRRFLLISLLMKHSCGCLAASSGIGFFLLLFCLLLKCTVLCHVVCCFITLRWTHGTENKVIHKIFPRSKLKPSTNSERNTSGPTANCISALSEAESKATFSASQQMKVTSKFSHSDSPTKMAKPKHSISAQNQFLVCQLQLNGTLRPKTQWILVE